MQNSKALVVSQRFKCFLHNKVIMSWRQSLYFAYLFVWHTFSCKFFWMYACALSTIFTREAIFSMAIL